MTSEKLTVAEALQRAEQIDRNLDAFDETAPQTVAAEAEAVHVEH